MTAFVVAESYTDYLRWMKEHFPNHYHNLNRPELCPLSYLSAERREEFDSALSFSRETLYFHVSGEIPQWFSNRFKRVTLP